MNHLYGSHPKDFTPGQRVAIHPSTSAWLSGLRFATVVKIGHKHVYVQLDNGKVRGHAPWQLRSLPPNLSCTCTEAWDWKCRIHGMND